MRTQFSPVPSVPKLQLLLRLTRCEGAGAQLTGSDSEPDLSEFFHTPSELTPEGGPPVVRSNRSGTRILTFG